MYWFQLWSDVVHLSAKVVFDFANIDKMFLSIQPCNQISQVVILYV